MLRSQKHGREPGALVSQAESWDDPQDSSGSNPRKRLKISTDLTPVSPVEDSDSPDSLFDNPGVNQIMLFGVASASDGLPPVLRTLLFTISALLAPILPGDVHSLLFPPTPARARQAILNLYRPGEGITPHVDLLRRFGDGIVGVSFGSGCVMQFARVAEAEGVRPLNLFLPERSVLVLSGDARYGWTHGIEERTADLVAGTGVVERGVRLSITFRWLLPGADVVGEQDGEKIALNI
ncbi:hypothetical protein DFH09DRAFT_1187448 [Mycena vulgaris]|nr:hypothetical protein DFH09DRAFT_1187448 [Mycena vulgaris]